MADLNLQLKAEASSAALKAVTGERPVISYENGYARLYWDSAQIARLQGKVDGRIKQGVTMALAPSTPPKKGELIVEWGPVVNPVLVRKAVPALLAVSAGVLVAGIVIGRLTKRSSRRG